MGKVVGLIGSASGKIGNIVYAVSNGIQTARVYQPIVANPKSVAQNLQRAKGNLAGRLSGITPRDAIVGLGGNNRTRRAAYLRNILLMASASVVDGVYSAKLQPSSLVFSRGSELPLINIKSATTTATGSMTVTYNRVAQVTEDEWTASGGSFVVVAIDPVNGGYDFVRVYNWTRGAFPSTPNEDLTQSLLVEQVQDHELYLYFVPFVIDNQNAATRTEGLTVDAAEYVATLGLTEASSLLSFGNSKFFGQVTVV